MIRTILAAALLLAAGGAAAAELTPQLEQTLRSRLEKNLADPYGAQIRLTKEPWRDSARIFDKTYEGQFVCASINAKNPVGGFIGFRPYLFIVQESGNVVVLSNATHFEEQAALIHAKCEAGA